MEIVYILAPLTLFIAISALVAFLWAVNKGQYDDLETPAHRILLDPPPLKNKTAKKDKE